MKYERESDSSLPPATDATASQQPGGRLSLAYFLRTFLLLNLALGLLIAINAGRAHVPMAEGVIAGPLWLATDPKLTKFNAEGAVPVLVLSAAMSAVLVWPSWWTAGISVAAAFVWIWIGVCIAAGAAC